MTEQNNFMKIENFIPGKDLTILTINKNPENNKKKALIICNQHPREMISAEACLNFI